jgi:hypothetical protein
MNSDWFAEWVLLHCEATAADAIAATALLANRKAFVETWHATPEELGTCTARLVEKCRVPQFANQHSDAVGNELHHLRLERDEAARLPRPDPVHTHRFGTPVRSSACRLCADTGFVDVPHPLCVECPHNDPPRIGFHPGTQRVYGGLVLCDWPDCRAGRRVRDAELSHERRRLTLSEYLRPFGGVDVLALWRQYHAEKIAEARRTSPRTDGDYVLLLRRIRERVAQSESGDQAA